MAYEASHNVVIDKDVRSRAEQDALNFTPSQVATTVYAASAVDTSVVTSDSQYRCRADALQGHETTDDGGTTTSKYTYRSDIDAKRFIRHIEGRAYNTLNETYFLPSDDDEWVRLNKQHVALVLSLGGLYPAADEVRALLAPLPGQRKRILDLGCGTGVWAMDMAHDFPEAEVVGVDLAPVPVDLETLPPNLRFEIDDINLGLAHFKDSFDVVHMRLAGSGLKSFRKTMRDGQQCLKPGGIAIFIDADYDMYAEDLHTYMPFALEDDEQNPEQTERSWWQQMRRAAINTVNSDIYGMSKAMDEGLWEDEIMDPETCRAASLHLPIGPWAQGESQMETQQLGYVGALIRQDLMSAHRAGHAVLKRLGWEPDRLDRWSELTDKQMMSLKPKTWLRMCYAWGRRRAAENEPAPPLSPIAPSTIAGADPTLRYPHYYIYQTREESLCEAALRNRGKDCEPPPLPKCSPRATGSPPSVTSIQQRGV
ncbi:hypothetical protein PIIN_00939 [Serendipita indica DSM 11827]|uniref:Methyltransferase domain-containing protein n=1 Tax=Serendipita indica (strain DSM 11827) TaxID=1109443 RepID=G4T6Y8_SERID|nr:hypothetical protein PIIN_00939 [Serendipita indica DSM 11827]